MVVEKSCYGSGEGPNLKSSFTRLLGVVLVSIQKSLQNCQYSTHTHTRHDKGTEKTHSAKHSSAPPGPHTQPAAPIPPKSPDKHY